MPHRPRLDQEKRVAAFSGAPSVQDAVPAGGGGVQALSEWQRTIIESSNHPIIATDTDGIIRHFNSAAETLLGYSAHEVIGRHTPALIHDAGEVAARAVVLGGELGIAVEPGFEVFVAKARLGEREELEWSYLRKDGARIPVLLSISALKDGAGTIIGFLGVAVDLRLRKELERNTAIAQAHKLSSEIINVIAQGILCLTPEPPYRVLFANPHAAGLLGMSEEEIKGRPLDEVFHVRAESIKDAEGLLQEMNPEDMTVFEAEVTSPGRSAPFSAALSIARTSGVFERIMVLSIQDVTQRRRIEQSLRLSSKVFEVCSEAIMITDALGTIVSVNPAFSWLTGYRPDEAVGRNPSMLRSGKHDAAFYNKLWTSLKTEGQWSGEIWDKRKDGSLYLKWLTIDAVRENGATTHYVGISHDITAHREHELRIRHLAEHDALTGLPNRRVLEQRVKQLIESRRQGDKHFAVAVIDLDRFKYINDTLGHLVGDQVLVEVARRLVQGVRENDTVVRLGGDEFVLLLTEIDEPRTLSEVISHIHRRLGEGIRIEGRLLFAPPSIGIACYPGDGGDIDTLLRHADAAMYRTKANGRNGWTFYTAEMNVQIAERMALEESLREALANGGLALHYQPLLDARQGEIVSWEALLRWNHPVLGVVPPERVIPVAEETGLIHPLGAWVVREACREIRRWQDQGLGSFRVSVNVSATQLESEDFPTVVLEAVRCHGISPGQLEIEITESVLMSHSPKAIQALDVLRSQGVVLTLDDFGTGYSSLAYLKSLCVDRVKIDRSFIANIASDRGDAAIVQAVVTLANSLSIGVVAEGVETEAQQQLLHASGCRELQGFLLGHPMPADDVAAFLEERQTA